jgi:hypothetical protein
MFDSKVLRRQSWLAYGLAALAAGHRDCPISHVYIER